MSVCPSECTEQLGSHPMDYHYSAHVSIFRKMCLEISTINKICPEQPVLYTSTRTAGTLYKHQNSRYFTQPAEQPVLYTSSRSVGTLHKHQNSRYFTQAPEQPVFYTSSRSVGTLHKHQNSRYFTQAPQQPVIYTSTRRAGTLHKHQNSRYLTQAPPDSFDHISLSSSYNEKYFTQIRIGNESTCRVQ